MSRGSETREGMNCCTHSIPAVSRYREAKREPPLALADEKNKEQSHRHKQRNVGHELEIIESEPLRSLKPVEKNRQLPERTITLVGGLRAQRQPSHHGEIAERGSAHIGMTPKHSSIVPHDG